MTGIEPALLAAATSAGTTAAATAGTTASIGSVLGTALSAINTIGGIYQTVQGIRSSRAQTEAHNREQLRRQEFQRAQQRIEQQRLERKRKSQLATARARLGAAGIGSTGGSGAALLGGINGDFDRELQESNQLFNLSQVEPNLLDDRPQRIRQFTRLGQQVIGLIPN